MLPPVELKTYWKFRINEVRKRYPDAEVYYLPLDYFRKNIFENMNEYRFHFVIDDKAGQDFPARFGVVNYALRWINIQKMLYQARRHGEVLSLGKIWDRIDVLIDISGYSLTSRFGISSINRVLRLINTAKSYGIKVILLPQSYGPFDFPTDICKRIGEGLSKVDLLFAREEDGIAALRKYCGIEKAVLFPDIVLQGDDIRWENVFAHEPKLVYPILKTSRNVGIIPNSELLRNGAHDRVLDIYRILLNDLLVSGKEVYIFRHSNDLPLCREIYALAKSNEHCHLIEDDIDCLSYGVFVRQFDFLIASRFHSIVHAYREGVPALILGWAVKYKNLAGLFGQEDYVFDLSEMHQVDREMLIEKLDRMIDHADEEANVISRSLNHIRQNNCFDQCSQIFDSILGV